MTKDDIEGVRVEFKKLMEAMVDMARSQGQPITEIMLVQRDSPRTIDALCDLALKGLAGGGEAAQEEVGRVYVTRTNVRDTTGPYSNLPEGVYALVRVKPAQEYCRSAEFGCDCGRPDTEPCPLPHRRAGGSYVDSSEKK